MRSRPVAKLHHSLESRLTTYALAAGAAGVGLAVFSQPAEAKIVYTRADKQLPVKLDLNHDGITDFLLRIGFGTYGSFGVTVQALKNNQVVGYKPHLSSGLSWASALNPGVKVGPNQRFGTYYWMVLGRCGSEAKGSSSSCFGSGPWNNVQNRYLGFEFFIKGKVHYGWARLNVTVGKTVNAVLTGYAYETVKNKALVTGQTKGSDAMAGPGTLGHLARGAAANSVIRETVPAHDARDYGSRETLQ